MSRPLPVRAPFHLEATVRLLQRRPSNRIDIWEPNRYRRVLTTPERLVAVEVWNGGSVDEPDVRYRVCGGASGGAARAALESTVRRMLGLDAEPGLWEQVADVDAQRPRNAEPSAADVPPGAGGQALRSVAAALRGARIPRYAELFEAFANVVPFQQVSLDAGTAIVGRLVERFGDAVERSGCCHRAFPTAAAIAAASNEALRACGFSARKAETLRHVARSIASGELAEASLESLPTDQALSALTALPGIGPWSAALVMLRGFGRADVFPSGDVGARRVVGRLLRLAPDENVERVAEQFGRLRGYLYFYALGSDLLDKDLVARAPALRA